MAIQAKFILNKTRFFGKILKPFFDSAKKKLTDTNLIKLFNQIFEEKN